VRILVHSPAFLPSLGGLETQTDLLARSLSESGDEVTVVTRTPAEIEPPAEYRVVRNPSAAGFLGLHRWAEVVLHQNLSLRGLWPLAFVRRPLVVAHHSWYRRPDGRIAWQDRLKRLVVGRAAGSISVSAAIAADLGSESVVIGNAFDERRFHTRGHEVRTGELLFVGRLVSDKGLDLLLDALARLAARGARPALTVVGSGPEREPAQRRALELGLEEQVRFAGPLSGEELAATYRRHRIVVIPSRYHEPFGIVALEGIACGCAVVASEGGGLRDAVGPCGRLFPNGDVAGLSRAIEELLGDAGAIERCRAAAEEHLAERRPGRVGGAYRGVLAAAVGEAGRAA
jgi:glycosyltransferase involved in cell wall biosynthesis